MYLIVIASEIRELENLVEAKLDEGWKLQGGVATGINNENTWYWAQAMIKEERVRIPLPERRPDKVV
jgi:hypothetical protein